MHSCSPASYDPELERPAACMCATLPYPMGAEEEKRLISAMESGWLFMPHPDAHKYEIKDKQLVKKPEYQEEEKQGFWQWLLFGKVKKI